MRKAPSGDVIAYPGYEQIELGDVASAKGVVIFLHGFGGAFTLPCWQLAQAAREAGLATVCPALGFRGDWWSREGRRIFADSLSRLRARGAKRVFLAGLSNGAVGASALARSKRLAGVILISGMGRGVPEGMPSLVLYGKRDRHFRRGRDVVTLEGGHFAFLLEHERAHAAIARWLASQVRNDVVEGVEGVVAH
jgi:pimeloyl-ACP methyl ester carboxylesterase